MHKYQILIEYVGTNYRGWQIQKNGISIQEKIQNAQQQASLQRSNAREKLVKNY